MSLIDERVFKRRQELNAEIMQKVDKEMKNITLHENPIFPIEEQKSFHKDHIERRITSMNYKYELKYDGKRGDFGALLKLAVGDYNFTPLLIDGTITMDDYKKMLEIIATAEIGGTLRELTLARFPLDPLPSSNDVKTREQIHIESFYDK